MLHDNAKRRARLASLKTIQRGRAFELVVLALSAHTDLCEAFEKFIDAAEAGEHVSQLLAASDKLFYSLKTLDSHIEGAELLTLEQPHGERPS